MTIPAICFLVGTSDVAGASLGGRIISSESLRAERSFEELFSRVDLVHLIAHEHIVKLLFERGSVLGSDEGMYIERKGHAGVT